MAPTSREKGLAGVHAAACSTHGSRRHMGAMCPEWTMGTVHLDVPPVQACLCCQAVRFMFCSEPAGMQPPCPTFTRETAALQAMFPTHRFIFSISVQEICLHAPGDKWFPFPALFLCFVLLFPDCECLGTGDGWVERSGQGPAPHPMLETPGLSSRVGIKSPTCSQHGLVPRLASPAP